MNSAITVGGGIRVCALACLLFAGVAAHAVQAPPPADRGTPLDMVDARVNLKDSYVRALAARPGVSESGRTAADAQAFGMTAAIARRLGATPALEIKRSPTTGGVTSIHDNAAALTAAAPGVASETIVRNYLLRNGDLFGLGGVDVNDIVVLGDSAGGASGLRLLRVEQQIGGRPIFQSESRFLLDRDGRLVKVVGMLVPAARVRTPAIDGAKLLTPGAAVSRLMGTVGHAIAPTAITTIADNGSGRLDLAAADSLIKGPITARQVLFPLAPGVLVPAWSLVVFTTGRQDWYAIVDAETGDLLWRKNIRSYASNHNARFRVFVQADGVTPADSPSPLSPTTGVAGVQPPGIAPTIVSMHTAQSLVGSPNGWINDCPGGGCTDNQTQTIGNNVLVCLDRISAPTTVADDNICDTAAGSVLDGNGRPTGNPDTNGRNRDFLGTAPRDFQTGYLPPPQGGNPEAGQTATGTGAALDSFRRGGAVQLFYVSNWYHDRLFQLGFDEASANFQQINFTVSGLGGDRVLADLQDGSGTNNANFSTPPDGTSGRMQMYRFTGPTIDRDAALDAEIVIHELAHGTTNRLVGNGAGLNWDPARAMGEGWSDFYALALLNNTNADDPDAMYAVGGYSTYKLGGLLDNYTYGIRRFPYSTDNAVNPLTWADVDDVTNDLSGGIPPSPLNQNDGGGMQVHNAGTVWALTLWEVRSRVIDDPAGANGNVPTGNQTMLQLVTDALKMTPIDPSFTEGRDAILQADCATNGCANEASIWGGFADRGLGYGARTPYNIMFGLKASHMGVKESFQAPFLDVVDAATDVTVNDSTTNNNGDIDPGETVRLLVKLTNPWRAAGKAVASATATLASTTPGVTIYKNMSSYGAIAPQGTATGTPFVVGISNSVLCGSAIDFTLTTVSSLGTKATTFRIRVGGASGTNSLITYTGVIQGGLAIPDNRPRAAFAQGAITDDFEIADLNFRIDNLTHTFTGDLTVALRSPEGVGSDLISLIGALTDTGPGDDLVNMVIDDQVTFSAANDMVQATAAAAPFTKSWLPVFNAPWSSLTDFGPPDPVGSLSRYNGTSTKGTWSVMVSDQVGGDTGTLNSFSLLVTPRRFVCSAPPPAAVSVTATKTVAGTFSIGGAVTYTVTLTNNGSGNQANNPGNEFTDVLPAGLTLVSASATSGTAVATIATNTVTWNGSLTPLGGSTTITINATVKAGTQGTTISNQGTVAFDADVNGTNEASAMTDDPGLGGASDPTSFVVASGGTAFVTSASNAAPTVIANLPIVCPASGLLVVTGSGESAAKSNFAGSAFIGVAYSIARDSIATDNGNVVQSSALAVFNGDATRDFLHVQRVDSCTPGANHIYRLTAYATTPQTSIVNGSFVWNGRLTASAGPASSSFAAGTTFIGSASNTAPTVVTTLPVLCPASGMVAVTGSGESAAKSTFAGNAFIGLAYSISRNSTATDNTNVVQSSALAVFNGDANRDFLNVQRIDSCTPGQTNTYRLTAYATTPQTGIASQSFVFNGRLTASTVPIVTSFAPGTSFVGSASNAAPTVVTTLNVVCPASGTAIVTGSGESAAKSNFAGNAFIGLAYSISRGSTATDNTNVVQSSALAVFNGDANRDFLNVQRVDSCTPGQNSTYRLTAYATSPQTSIASGSFVWNGRLVAVLPP